MVLFGVAPAPFCVVSLFFCWRNANLAGRFAGSSLLPFFVCSLFFCVSMMCLGCEAKEFHIFCTLFYRFSHCQDRALERDRPQQRKKKVVGSVIVLRCPFASSLFLLSALGLVGCVLVFPCGGSLPSPFPPSVHGG